jgi:hypothetical protein
MSILFAQLARKHRGGALLVLRFPIPMLAVTSTAISLVTIPTASSASTSTTAIMEVHMWPFGEGGFAKAGAATGKLSRAAAIRF